MLYPYAATAPSDASSPPPSAGSMVLYHDASSPSPAIAVSNAGMPFAAYPPAAIGKRPPFHHLSMPAPTEVLAIMDDETAQRKRPRPNSAHRRASARIANHRGRVMNDIAGAAHEQVQDVLETIDSSPVEKGGEQDDILLSAGDS